MWRPVRQRSGLSVGACARYKRRIRSAPDIGRQTPARRVAAALRAGLPLRDAQFDALYETPVRTLSAVHWSPLEACVRVAGLLSRRPGDRVLDIGAGPGKFCLVAALTTPGTFVGVEQRPDFTKIARRLATELEADRATFIEADALDLDWRGYAGLYFYNPFLDDAEPGVAMDRLRTLSAGTRVAVYHALGGPMPDGYTLRSSERIQDEVLELWEKCG